MAESNLTLELLEREIKAANAICTLQYTQLHDVIGRMDTIHERDMAHLEQLIRIGLTEANASINALRERLTMSEGRTMGMVVEAGAQQAARSGHAQGSSLLIAVIVAVVSFLGMVGTIAIGIFKH